MYLYPWSKITCQMFTPESWASHTTYIHHSSQLFGDATFFYKLPQEVNSFFKPNFHSPGCFESLLPSKFFCWSSITTQGWGFVSESDRFPCTWCTRGVFLVVERFRFRCCFLCFDFFFFMFRFDNCIVAVIDSIGVHVPISKSMELTVASFPAFLLKTWDPTRGDFFLPVENRGVPVLHVPPPRLT